MRTHASLPDPLDLLRDSARTGVYACSEETARALFHAGPAAGLNAYRIDLGLVQNTEQLHKVLARALRFPDWYGHNWDALADSLTDLSWAEADGYLLIFQRAQGLASSAPDSFVTLCEVLAQASSVWRNDRQPFWALFIDAPGALPSLEVRA